MSENTSNIKLTNPIVLFDGVCNFCNTSVKFILAYNREENLHFAPLQSNFGKQLLEQYGLSSQNINTVVFIENGEVFTKSSASFQIAYHLIYPWKTLYFFRHIPRNITNWVYELIAKNRYSWFGKKDQCMIPKPEWRERFHE